MMNNTDGNNFQFLAFYCSVFIMCPLSKVEVHLQNSLFCVFLVWVSQKRVSPVRFGGKT